MDGIEYMRLAVQALNVMATIMKCGETVPTDGLGDLLEDIRGTVEDHNSAIEQSKEASDAT